MTDQQARYDRISEGYATWWAPVHRPATLRLLDVIDEDRGPRPATMVDVGCGTGAFAAAAVRRWPAAQVDGVDVSAGMLAIAERERAGLAPAERARLRFRQAPADRLPYADGTFDVAASAFVLQLVPNRFSALREMHRVLRPGGRIAVAAWLEGGEPFPADAAYDEALAAAGLEPRPLGGGNDVRSPANAEAVLRRAGFRVAAARAGELRHRFTPRSYLEFVARFDDEDLFSTMDQDARAALEADVLRRLADLPPDGLLMVLPVVFASAIRG